MCQLEVVSYSYRSTSHKYHLPGSYPTYVRQLSLGATRYITKANQAVFHCGSLHYSGGYASSSSPPIMGGKNNQPFKLGNTSWWWDTLRGTGWTDTKPGDNLYYLRSHGWSIQCTSEAVVVNVSAEAVAPFSDAVATNNHQVTMIKQHCCYTVATINLHPALAC